MVRQKLDLSLRLPPLGNVLVGANPAAVFQWLVVDRDEPSVAEFLKEYSLLATIDERLARGIDLVDAAAGIVAKRATVGEHVVKPHAGVQPAHRLVVNPAELFVDQMKPVISVIQADALREVRDRLLEALPQRARSFETPGQVVAYRGPNFRDPPAPGMRPARSIFLTPHCRCPTVPER